MAGWQWFVCPCNCHSFGAAAAVVYADAVNEAKRWYYSFLGQNVTWPSFFSLILLYSAPFFPFFYLIRLPTNKKINKRKIERKGVSRTCKREIDFKASTAPLCIVLFSNEKQTPGWLPSCKFFLLFLLTGRKKEKARGEREHLAPLLSKTFPRGCCCYWPLYSSILGGMKFDEPSKW